MFKNLGIGTGILGLLFILFLIIFYVDFSAWFEFFASIAVVIGLICLFIVPGVKGKLITVGICLGVAAVLMLIYLALCDWNFARILEVIFGESSW